MTCLKKPISINDAGSRKAIRQNEYLGEGHGQGFRVTFGNVFAAPLRGALCLPANFTAKSWYGAQKS
ncbi:hypothetical protein HW537_11300 [Asaia siamensis]